MDSLIDESPRMATVLLYLADTQVAGGEWGGGRRGLGLRGWGLCVRGFECWGSEDESAGGVWGVRVDSWVWGHLVLLVRA